MKSKSTGKRPQPSGKAKEIREQGAPHIPSLNQQNLVAKNNTDVFLAGVRRMLAAREKEATPPPSTEGNPSKKE